MLSAVWATPAAVRRDLNGRGTEQVVNDCKNWIQPRDEPNAPKACQGVCASKILAERLQDPPFSEVVVSTWHHSCVRPVDPTSVGAQAACSSLP